MLRPARPARRRRAALHRPDRAAGRGRRRGAAAGRLAGARRPSRSTPRPRCTTSASAAAGTSAPAAARSSASPTRPSTSTIPTSPQRSGLAGESVLLAALNATRTGRMTDIVRTIQAEQDRIIRADHRGVLVVQGGPGTGKTAVALHRAAYLLYTHRERLARSGLLIVGPSPTFLRYIADVLPSLGETGVVLADLGSLRPGVRGARGRAAGGRRGQGPARHGRRDRRRRRRSGRPCPDAPVEITVDGTTLRFTPTDAARARTRGRAASRLHNEARPAVRPPGRSTGWPRSTPTGSAPTSAAAASLLDAARPRRAAPRGRRRARRARADRPAVAAADRRAAGRATCSPPASGSSRRRPAGATPTATCCCARRRRPWTPGRRPAARGGRRAARRRRLRAARRRPARRAAAPARRPGDPRPAARLPLAGRRDRGGGRGAQRLRPARRRGPGRPAGGARHPDDGRAGRRRPHLDLRPRDRRRGAGALGDGLAAAAAPLPDPLDDAGRRRRPDRVARRRDQLGRGAHPAPRHALADGGADRQLPHPRRDHGGRGRGPRRGRVDRLGRASRCARPASVRGRCGWPRPTWPRAVADGRGGVRGGGRARSPSSRRPAGVDAARRPRSPSPRTT